MQLTVGWERRLLDQAQASTAAFGQAQQKMDRPRFAQSELGIRQPLLLLLLVRSPPVASSLYALLSAHVPVRALVPQAGAIPELPAGAQAIPVHPGPVPLLSAIANQSLHNSADWFFLLPDSIFLNLFQLRRLLQSIQWNVPLALGQGQGRCLLEGGILLSASALQALVQQRHHCHGLLPNGQNEDSALETCIRLATNLSCSPNGQTEAVAHGWWKVGQEDPSAGSVHDQVGRLSTLAHFNESLTVSPLLSERDVLALEQHFLGVELARTEGEIGRLEAEMAGQFGEEEEEGEGVGWPIGAVQPEKAPNRFQVPTWELVDEKWHKFGNDPERNLAELEGEEERLDWEEVLGEARRRAHCGQLTGLKQAYRRFSPGRGVDFLVDLECGGPGGRRRVQLLRPIHSTKLLEKMPFVKEDRQLAILIPVNSAAQVRASRFLLRRILSICLQTGPAQGRQLRVLVAAREIEAKLVRLLGADLGEMKRRCPHSLLDSSLLLLKPDPRGQTPLQVAAMDEAVDRLGQQSLFLLLPPYADFQADFLDRTRLNAIRHFQVFFPVPFVQFSHFVLGTAPKEAEMFLVHKDRGRFDPDDWQAAALFGADFVSVRARVPMPSSSSLSLSALFLAQSQLQILRPIEPSLRIRPHPRICPQESLPERRRCERRRMLALGTRAQLARLLVAGQA